MSEDNAEVIENVEPADIPAADPIESEAKESGWLDKDAWVEAGRDAKEHRSAEIFIERGEWIGKQKELTKRMDKMQHDFETREANANLLRNKQIESDRAQLIAERSSAVNDDDVAGVNAAQNKIDNLQQPVDVQQPIDPVFTRYQADNGWLSTGSDEANFAISQVSHYQSLGMDATACLNAMEKDMESKFPKAQAVPPASMAEGGSKPGTKPAAGKITMSDLTAEENKIWNNNSHMWKGDKKVFLQAVKDARTEK